MFPNLSRRVRARSTRSSYVATHGNRESVQARERAASSGTTRGTARGLSQSVRRRPYRRLVRGTTNHLRAAASARASDGCGAEAARARGARGCEQRQLDKARDLEFYVWFLRACRRRVSRLSSVRSSVCWKAYVDLCSSALELSIVPIGVLETYRRYRERNANRSRRTRRQAANKAFEERLFADLPPPTPFCWKAFAKQTAVQLVPRPEPLTTRERE